MSVCPYLGPSRAKEPRAPHLAPTRPARDQHLATLSALGGPIALIAQRIYQETLVLAESPEIARRLANQWGR